MQVGTEHDIDVLRTHAERGKIAQKAAAALIPLRHQRPRLVVAKAGIDEDRVGWRTHQQRMESHHQQAAVTIEEARILRTRGGEHLAVGGEREEMRGGTERPFELDQPIDSKRTDEFECPLNQRRCPLQ